MKVIDRYVASETIGPFLIGIVGFVLVMTVDLLFTMADWIINKGVPLWAVLKLLVYKLPSILVMTFPVATLFGAAMAMGRLSKDNEIVALRTSGVTLFRISVSILAMGIIISLISFFTNERIVPYANHVSDDIIRQVIYRQPLPDIKENVFFKDAQNRYYYARRVNMKNKVMENVMVYEVSGDNFPRVILAQKAFFQGKIWQLKDGIIHKFNAKGYLSYEAVFSAMKLNVSEELMNFSSQKTTQEMDTNELKSMIKMVEKSGLSVSELRTELLMKYSLPLTCLVFALVGIPFSIPSPRSGRTWGVLMTIVFMFTFYVFASVFRSLGRGGLLQPAVAAFAPQVTFSIIAAVVLFWETKFR